MNKDRTKSIARIFTFLDEQASEEFAADRLRPNNLMTEQEENELASLMERIQAFIRTEVAASKAAIPNGGAAFQDALELMRKLA